MPSGVIFDAAGNLYGTTTEGGLYSLRHRPYGIAFKLTPEAGGAWTETILHSFGGGKDGAFLRHDAMGRHQNRSSRIQRHTV